MDDEIRHWEERLALYRTTQQHLLDQAAKYGGEGRLPTPQMHELRDTRAAIASLKARLRAQGVSVADKPDDFPLHHTETPPVSVAQPSPSRGQSRRFFMTLLGLVVVGLLLLVVIVKWPLYRGQPISSGTSTPERAALATPSTALNPTATLGIVDAISMERSLVGNDQWNYRYTDAFCATSCTQIIADINGNLPDNGRFLVTRVIVSNQATTSRMLPHDFFLLQDSAGIIYHTRPDLAQQYIRRGQNADYMEEDSIPARQKTGYDYSILLIFDVPSDATNLVLFGRDNLTQGWLIHTTSDK